MNLFPAIDIKDNKCVRLTRGNINTSIIFNEEPVEQALFFQGKGVNRIHIVDLDAAFGNNKINSKSITSIRKAVNIPIQLGGGIRSMQDANYLKDIGIDYLIIGSIAVTNFELLIQLADLYQNQIYVSLDILNNNIMVKGWEEKTNYLTKDIINKYKNTNIRGFVLTDVSRDGMLSGLNIEMLKSNIQLTKKNFIVGGGLKSYNDLVKLKKIDFNNLEGVIAGKSFYVGNIELEKAKNILEKNA